MVPPANGERLAGAIPGAEHRTWPDTAHLYFTDEPDVDRHVAEWLRAGPTSRGCSGVVGAAEWLHTR
jgi:hypothetical protein